MRNVPSPHARDAIQRVVMENRRVRATHPSPQLITDGVMAGYIHEISSRHANGTREPSQRRRRGDQR